MDQALIPAVVLRGGSARGVFFHAKDLPTDRAKQDAIVLSVLGSPDPDGRQIDGMGGGTPALSQAVIIGPSTHADADLDCTFARLAMDRPLVDRGSDCLDLCSAVGPFAVDEGLLRASDGEALLRIHLVNTRRILHARFLVRGRRAATAGDFAMAGVPGTGARIRLDILHPGGGATGSLLPTGHAMDVLEHAGRAYRATMIDAADACVFLDAGELGLTDIDKPGPVVVPPATTTLLDALRRAAALRMGLSATPGPGALAIPHVAVVAPPSDPAAPDGAAIGARTHEIAMRMIPMACAAGALPLAAGMALGVACRIAGSLPHAIAAVPDGDALRIAGPSGILSVGAEVRHDGAAWVADTAAVFRSARRLMQGSVAVPIRLL